MKIIRGLQSKILSGCVATVGNFDGMHIGHQAILKKIKQVSLEMQLPSVVILFEPQPEEFFSGENCPARLTRFREKMLFLEKFKIDVVWVIYFDRDFAAWTADDFVEKLLVKTIDAKYLLIGNDFHFGRKRTGGYAFLEEAAKRFHFRVEQAQTISMSDRRVSSTWVRELLQAGDLNSAEKLLGQCHSMCGRVVHGEKRGRQIDFPTANIYLHRKKAALYGVYAVLVWGLTSEPITGVANVGRRPTVKNFEECLSLLEVHLFNFNQDIYGHHVRVEFLQKIRDEKRFDSIDLLRDQIAKDVLQAKAFFRIL